MALKGRIMEFTKKNYPEYYPKVTIEEGQTKLCLLASLFEEEVELLVKDLNEGLSINLKRDLGCYSMFYNRLLSESPEEDEPLRAKDIERNSYPTDEEIKSAVSLKLFRIIKLSEKQLVIEGDFYRFMYFLTRDEDDIKLTCWGIKEVK